MSRRKFEDWTNDGIGSIEPDVVPPPATGDHAAVDRIPEVTRADRNRARNAKAARLCALFGSPAPAPGEFDEPQTADGSVKVTGQPGGLRGLNFHRTQTRRERGIDGGGGGEEGGGGGCDE